MRIPLAALALCLVGCGQATQLTPASMLFVGDSITNNTNWQGYFPQDHVMKCSKPGATSSKILALCTPAPSQTPDYLFVMMGTNDIAKGDSDEAVIANYRSLRAAYPKSAIVIESILPTDQALFMNTNPTGRITRLNEKLKHLARELSLTYLDLFPSFAEVTGSAINSLFLDGEHPDSAGYSIWIKAIQHLLLIGGRS